MTKKCIVRECTKTASAKGYCRMHYERLKRHGDPLSGRTVNGALPSFIDAACRCSSNECLIWPYGRTVYGYGVLRVGGKIKLAHRVVCERTHGKPPTLKHECAHSCGNGHSGCINPQHLRWASPKENQADRVDHGTHNIGQRNGRSKLTESQVLEIREIAKDRTKTQREIAILFGIAASQVSAICNRKSWSYIE